MKRRYMSEELYMDAPQVDGLLFLASEEELMSGDIVRARIYRRKGL